MSREIKFRIYVSPEYLSKFSYTSSLPGMKEVTSLHISTNNANVGRVGGNVNYPLEECPLSQYTGLKDKNGVEIYENDIVKGFMDKLHIVRFGRYIGLDYYDQLAEGWYLEQIGAELDVYGLVSGNYKEASTCEVVGNIYQSPELLKESL